MALLPLLVLGILGGSAGAQESTADPLADFDFDSFRDDELRDLETGQEPPTAVQIRGAQTARATCNRLVDDINRLSGLWDQVRTETLDRETFGFELAEAEEAWGLDSAACLLDRSKLTDESAMATRTLEWEVAQYGTLWQPLLGLSRAWLEERPRQEINTAAALYGARLEAYVAWLPQHAIFWEGSWLKQGGPRSCLDQNRDGMDRLATGIRAQMSTAPENRLEEDRSTLIAEQKALFRGIDLCRASENLSSLQRVELDLMQDQLKVYRDAITGLGERDAAALQRTMEKEQELTGRLLRCRQEHARGDDAVTPSCRPTTP